MFLNFPKDIESEELDEFYRRGWSPEDTANRLRMQLMEPILPTGKY
jgi:hypothetical protein